MKSRPEDFLVWENLALELTRDAERAPSFQYVRLRKCGFTTSEAVAIVADKLGVAAAQVQYAGLKDEDGITEQMLAVPGSVAQERLVDFNDSFVPREERFLRLTSAGFGDQPVEVGALEGNTFLITLTGVSDIDFERIALQAKSAVYFVNYYDVQRFGVPDGPKTTHEIGAALERGDHDSALRLLIAAKVPESAQAEAHVGPASEYFATIDPRRLAFYRSSAASFAWNAGVRDLVVRECKWNSWVRERREGIEYLHPTKRAELVSILRSSPVHHGVTYRAALGALHSRPMARDTVTQTRMRCWRAGADAVRLGFQLPPGTYATMAVRQLCIQAGVPL